MQPVELHFQNYSLPDILALWSAKTGRHFLMDDAPLRQRVSLDFQGTLAASLDRVTEAFDYSWTVSKNGFMMMSSKR